GEAYLSPSVSKYLVQSYARGATRRSELERLTSRQREVLQLIAEGYTTKAIAARLTLSVKTVETHRAQLMERLDIRDIAGLVRFALRSDGSHDVSSAAWSEPRELLGELSRSRARAGYSPLETAAFVLSLKRPLFDRLRGEIGGDADALADEVWQATLVLDRLALFTTELHQKSRDEIILRQQQDMLELSTPVVQLWESILALPLIGTLDSARTQVVMENLLQRI